jgi:hypothetical protein
MMNTQQSTKPMSNLNFPNNTDLIVISIIAFFLGGMVSLLLSILLMVGPLKGEAVEKGYAEWKVVDNNTGETKFAWK